MNTHQLQQRFAPAVQEIIDLCRVTDDFIDKDMFRIYIATIWGNAALDPGKSGIRESELPDLHDFLNQEIENILGRGQSVTSCYEYLVSKAGEDCLERLSIGQRHREFLMYFARIILSREIQGGP